ncbi:GNAT family N-acetyltransferase [Pseudomonas sp. LS1212]|uniref:GNAT family N-acetyltransferase n=1 Tax=Pseudomonas sp. LS1212 TaxID=2972478 RepID=UPI00215C01DB|nr:GNAT family N-acetyltransferase [Pseudomonas sp. LS1212]UVJ42371.1 GNAT family N-acetyltransferase [Pseudomonas sp. LS1212]
MKFIFSECEPKYSSYTFPYVVWAVPETGSEIPELYNRGFLPSQSARFYLARSARIVLSDFRLSYSNRRNLRKCQDVEVDFVQANSFELTPEVADMCLHCAELRYGKGVVDSSRLTRIFMPQNATGVMRFKRAGRVVGLVTINIAGKMAHYNFAFYDMSFPKKSLGTFMLTAIINYFHERNYTYVYMGTCYALRFMYKSHFEGFEFFSGAYWSSNVSELEYLLKQTVSGHLLESDEYLKKFHLDVFDVNAEGVGSRYRPA